MIISSEYTELLKLNDFNLSKYHIDLKIRKYSTKIKKFGFKKNFKNKNKNLCFKKRKEKKKT